MSAQFSPDSTAQLQGKKLAEAHSLLQECGYNFYEVHPECYRNFSYVKFFHLLEARGGVAQSAPALIRPDVLMNVVNAKINDYVELHNRGDLTERGEHAWLAMTNLRRDLEFALKAPPASSTDYREAPLDLAWEAVNALGGSPSGSALAMASSYDQGIYDTVEKALEVIEGLGGEDPAPKRTVVTSKLHRQEGS